jgi:hypothetical protein
MSDGQELEEVPGPGMDRLALDRADLVRSIPEAESDPIAEVRGRGRGVDQIGVDLVGARPVGSTTKARIHVL